MIYQNIKYELECERAKSAPLNVQPLLPFAKKQCKSFQVHKYIYKQDNLWLRFTIKRSLRGWVKMRRLISLTSGFVTFRELFFFFLLLKAD